MKIGGMMTRNQGERAHLQRHGMAPLILLLVLLWAIPAAPADRLVTLEARDTPLIEVLKQLSTQTGYAFILDSTWSDLIVSTVLKDSPLHAGLRQILGRLNHALVYLPDNRIRLIISMLKGGINVDMPAGKGSLSIAQDDRQTFLAGAAASRRSLRL
jgi:hypothetical protein